MKFVEQLSKFTRQTIVLLAVFFVAGCGGGCKQVPPHNTFIETTIANASTNDLDWVRLKWEAPDMSAGILSQGISTTILDFPWPNLSRATLTFVDDKTRQRYSINLSFDAANEKIRSQKCHRVTIRILSYEKAEVVCE